MGPDISQWWAGPAGSSFPLPSFSRHSWVAVAYVASWKVETKRSNVQSFCGKGCWLSPSTSCLLTSAPWITLLNKVLAWKPLPQVLFCGESRVTHVVWMDPRSQRSTLVHWLRCGGSDVIAVRKRRGSAWCERVRMHTGRPSTRAVKQMRAMCLWPQQCMFISGL